MAKELKYISDSELAKLRSDIPANVARYRVDGFSDLASEPGWDIGLGIDYDDELLGTLDPSKPQQIAPVDLKNSFIVGKSLEKLTPALANEERIWVRLAHVEGFDYSRTRWLEHVGDPDLPGAVHKHFFAATQTRNRDDQSLSRLWWNYFIAKSCMPHDIASALNLILKTADIRQNFIERIWMTSRKTIAGAILEAMTSDPWITGAQNNFRAFMKAINRFGGGIVFEALDENEAADFVSECVKAARAHLAST